MALCQDAILLQAISLIKLFCSPYRFAVASEAARTDWTSFTKGYFLNRDTLVAVLLLVDASIPPQKIDFDCANWLGRNNVSSLLHNLFPFLVL